MVPALLAFVLAVTPNTRSWECVPSVVKSDASESFRLVVSTDTPVRGVAVQASVFLFPTGSMALRDDGLGGDVVAGDQVYTSGALTPDLPAAYLPMLAHFRRDPDSPEGIGYLDVGTVTITEIDGSVSEFLLWPELGLILPEKAAVPKARWSEGIQGTSHVLNVRHSTAAQRKMRGLSSDLQTLTRSVYSILEDNADFMVFLCPKKVELTPDASGPNFNGGLFQPVKVDFDGTGRARFDGSVAWGSAGRLRGLAFLDCGQWGIYSANLVHEIMHLWSPLLYPPILGSDQEHYSGLGNMGSILGGFLWQEAGDESLLAASRGTGTILKFDARTGAFSKVFADVSAVIPDPGGLFQPPGGNLFVSAAAGALVAEVNAGSGQLVRAYGADGEISSPRGMALGPNNSLLVASNGNSRILKYDLASGAYLGVFAAGAELSGPLGIVRAPNGNYLVASGNNDQIVEYEGTTGGLVRVWASGGAMDQPFGLAFGPNGNLFIVSYNTDQILEYAWPGGAFVKVFAQGCTLDKPTWIAFRSDGHLLASNGAADYVVQYNQDGQCVATGLAGPPLKQPRGLVVQPGSPAGAVNCDEGRNGGHRAAAIDLYAMGLLGASEVPDIALSDPSAPWPLQSCGQVMTVSSVVPFAAIPAALGPRPAADARDFRIAFIVETDGRLLNATELAFYHILAEHLERQVSPAAPDPYVGFNWVPLSRYFQMGTTWASRLDVRCDFDGDADIDRDDLDLFEQCATGPRIPRAAGCVRFDLDADNDVDQADYGLFQARFTGPRQ